MSTVTRFEQAFTACPLIAILRGISPGEVLEIAEVLFDSGLRVIEVPLNSPDPFDSIARLVSRFGDKAIIGAGTVTSIAQVSELRRIGATAVISPHFDPAVICATVAAEMISLPGVLSPSEAFAALAAGAHGLKLFPMEMIGVSGVKAMRAVLPKATRLIAVGGVGLDNLSALRLAGCAGFGVGSTLYKPGDLASVVKSNAIALLATLRTEL